MLEFVLRARKSVLLVSFVAVCGIGHAGWTVTNLHPAGAADSVAYGVSGNKQFGTATVGQYTRAMLWTGSAASATALSPAGRNGTGYGISGDQQVGYDQFGALWNDTSASRINLNPIGSPDAVATSVSGSQQAGLAQIGGKYRAGTWAGTAESFIDLGPPNATYSEALATCGYQQVGDVVFAGSPYHAAMWSGTPETWIDLHPAFFPTYLSAATGTSGDQQVGFVTASQGSFFPIYACLWKGSADSLVLLNSAGVQDSIANAVADGFQVGGTRQKACLWSGTPESFEDLHSALPTEFRSSEAKAISSTGSTTYISGWGYNTLTHRTEAILWTRPRRTVSGVINTAGGKKLTSISIQFRLAGTMTNVGGAYAVPVQINGTYTIRTPDSGNFDMTVNPPGYLRRTIHTDSTNANVINANLNLRPGDIVDDNVIDLSDYTKLITYFNKTSTDPSWNSADAEGISPAMADIDGNNVVDLTDYTRLITNFNSVGDN